MTLPVAFLKHLTRQEKVLLVYGYAGVMSILVFLAWPHLPEVAVQGAADGRSAAWPPTELFEPELIVVETRLCSQHTLKGPRNWRCSDGMRSDPFVLIEQEKRPAWTQHDFALSQQRISRKQLRKRFPRPETWMIRPAPDSVQSQTIIAQVSLQLGVVYYADVRISRVPLPLRLGAEGAELVEGRGAQCLDYRYDFRARRMFGEFVECNQTALPGQMSLNLLTTPLQTTSSWPESFYVVPCSAAACNATFEAMGDVVSRWANETNSSEYLTSTNPWEPATVVTNSFRQGTWVNTSISELQQIEIRPEPCGRGGCSSAPLSATTRLLGGWPNYAQERLHYGGLLFMTHQPLLAAVGLGRGTGADRDMAAGSTRPRSALTWCCRRSKGTPTEVTPGSWTRCTPRVRSGGALASLRQGGAVVVVAMVPALISVAAALLLWGSSPSSSEARGMTRAAPSSGGRNGIELRQALPL